MQRVSVRRGTMQRMQYLHLHGTNCSGNTSLKLGEHLYGGWIMDFHWSFQRDWMDVERQHGEDSAYGYTELKEARDSSTFWIRSIEMGNGKHDSTFDMSEVWDGLQGPDCNGSGSTSLAKLLNWAGDHSNSQKMYFQDFKIAYFPRVQNEIADSLARNACSFHRPLCFIGCSIPIWLPRPPQVWVIEQPFAAKKNVYLQFPNNTNLNTIRDIYK